MLPTLPMKNPGEQAVAFGAPEAATKLPAGLGEHAGLPGAAKEPGAQLAQLAPKNPLALPAAQGPHALAPVESAEEPGGQGSQLSSPLESANVCVAQEGHVPAHPEKESQKDPTPQGAHLEAPAGEALPRAQDMQGIPSAEGL